MDDEAAWIEYGPQASACLGRIYRLLKWTLEGQPEAPVRAVRIMRQIDLAAIELQKLDRLVATWPPEAGPVIAFAQAQAQKLSERLAAGRREVSEDLKAFRQADDDGEEWKRARPADEDDEDDDEF